MMEGIMDILIVPAVTGLAVWYLYRHFSRDFSSGDGRCGSSGCGGCQGRSQAPSARNGSSGIEFCDDPREKPEREDGRQA